ncbi:contactin-4-like [Hydractinia symbiolongicarpus]|uniref:contactin-4-like n=1 Tax=Hydractinia symbiolongicarpus TaxID=13093 RepID=UPI00254D3F47|nr:contactin-4-like [Hydractinia symbiolongicarpus]
MDVWIFCLFCAIFLCVNLYADAAKYVRKENTVQKKKLQQSSNPSFRKPKFMRYISEKRHNPGSDVILPCMSSGIRPIIYTWKLNGEVIEKRHRIKFAHKKSMLKIKRIRNADVGTYTCIASNAYGNLTFDFDIKMTEKKKEPVLYDYSMMVRRHISIRLMSQSVRFQCHAEAEKNVHYIWLKNGKPFRHIKPKAQSGEPSDMSNDGENAGDLVLNNLKVNDGGKYTCVAFNQYGNVSFTYELRILRKLSGGPPKVIPYTRPQIQHASVGENVTLDCLEIISVTIPDVRWFHLYNTQDRSVLPDIPEYMNWDSLDNDIYKSEYIDATQYSSFKIRSLNNKPKNEYLFDDTDPSGLRLNLRNVSTADTGAYSCYVSNFEGSDFATFFLIVSGGDSNSSV